LNEVSAGPTGAIEIQINEKAHKGVDGTLVPAIKGLCLDIAYHSMTVLMGPSGCGKTTLLRIIAGLDEHFLGKINLPNSARIGFVFQEPRLLEEIEAK
jgi:ABC-type sugar transport system ATPase subunit